MTVYTVIGHITNAILTFEPLPIPSNLSGGPHLKKVLDHQLANFFVLPMSLKFPQSSSMSGRCAADRVSSSFFQSPQTLHFFLKVQMHTVHVAFCAECLCLSVPRISFRSNLSFFKIKARTFRTEYCKKS